MGVLLSGEVFGYILTMVGGTIYAWTNNFSIVRTIIGVLISLGGIKISLEAFVGKKCLIGHIMIWALILLTPVMPPALREILGVVFALAFLPFVLGIVKWIYGKLTGSDGSVDDPVTPHLPAIIYDSSNVQYQRVSENDSYSVYQNTKTGAEVTIWHPENMGGGTSVSTSEGTFHWY